FPVDGTVHSGETLVNEAMLTGESLPMAKGPGSPVLTGTLNQSQPVVMEAARMGQATILAQIIRWVEAAQARKAPIQRLADRVAGYFAYGVMAIALLTFVFWAAWGTDWWPAVLDGAGVMPNHSPAPMADMMGNDHRGLLLSLKLAIAVLVVACPCALGLATPTAIVVGTGLGAEKGLLIRGGDVLEAIQHLDTVVFDKTGTLTLGQPIVTHYWLAMPGATMLETPEQLLQLAASLEIYAQHPFAVAIQAKAQALGLAHFSVADWAMHPGGLSAQWEGNTLHLGSLGWLETEGVVILEGDRQRADALAQQGHSVVFLALNRHCVGGIAMQDPLRPDAIETVRALQQQSLRVMMITGDQRTTAMAIAQQLGLNATDVLAEISPTGKAQAIQGLQTSGRQVGMVGDGINDAPALAQADVGIALSSGTDAAIETAQIVLTRGELRSPRLWDVVLALKLGRATFRTIRQNLFWAFAYNALGIPVAAGVLLPTFHLVLSPAAAAALMALSSVSVVTNALRLRFIPLETG
ncbi:MAG: heavy metal translocating P-type ATPase, partial [Thermosynechococcaceae cyanobacterium]